MYPHWLYSRRVSDKHSAPDSLLPLPPATFHILVAVADEDRHGYAIIQDIEARQFDEALPDIEAVIDDPRLIDYLREEPLLLAHFRKPNYPSVISLLRIVSRHYCATGRIDDGKRIARRALQLATTLEKPTGESHYNLARAHVLGQIRPGDIKKAANQLFHAFVANPLYKERYVGDARFNVVRDRIDAILANKPDPSDEYHRRLAAVSSPKGR